MKNNSTKKGLNNPTTNIKLTNAEEEILDMITKDFSTIKQIALRRKCSLQAVYKIIKKLKEKGVLSKGLTKVENFQSSKVENDKRLHGQEWNIKILWQDYRYQKHYKKSNVRFIDGHTVRLYRNSIEIYAGEGTSFWGETEQRATTISLKYWEKFFHKLSHLLDIIIIKPRSENIKLVNQHYGNINDNLVKDFKKREGRIRIFANEDGKLWFDMDESFKFKEREHPHPETAKQDSEIISKHMNDIRDKNPPTNSELAKIQAETSLQLNKLVYTIGEYGKYLKSHTGAMINMEKTTKKLRKTIDNLSKIVEKKNIKEQFGNQTQLDNFI